MWSGVLACSADAASMHPCYCADIAPSIGRRAPSHRRAVDDRTVRRIAASPLLLSLLPLPLPTTTYQHTVRMQSEARQRRMGTAEQQAITLCGRCWTATDE